MARIPLKVGNRGLETGSVVSYPSGDPIGQSVEQGGGRIAQIGGRFIEQNERFDNFQLQIAQQKLDLDLQGDLDAAAREMPKDGGGFHDGFVGQLDPETDEPLKPGRFDERVKKVREELPESVRDRFDETVPLLRKEYSNRAGKLEYGARQDFYELELTKFLTNVQNTIGQIDPNDTAQFQAFRARGEEAINATGLPAIKKEQELLKWRQTSAEAVWQALAIKDPEAAKNALGIGGGVSASVVDKIIAAESGGDPNAKNPNTTATGPAQFTSSTWMRVIKTYAPALAEGLSRAQTLALRTNAKISRSMTEFLTKENSAKLSAAGLPVTDGNLFLAHFAGGDGATKVLRAVKTGQGHHSAAALLGDAALKANPFLQGMSAEDLTAWADKKMAGPDGKAADKADPRFRDITLDRRLQLANFAEGELRAAYSAETELTTQAREEITKSGYDLMRDKTLTPEWVEANRDILNVSDYKVFTKALMPETKVKATPPKEYLRLLDLADSSPARAIDEARDLYANNVISKDVFNTIRGRAEKLTKTKDFSDELRSYVSTALTPEKDAPQSHYARKLDALFQFDDWLEKHQGAAREDIRKQAQIIIDDYRQIRYASGVTSLPLPRFTSSTPDTLTPDEIEKVKQRTIQSFQSGKITKREAAEQAALIRRWSELLKYRD